MAPDTRSSRISSLGDLLDPVGEAAFFERSFEKEPLHVKRGRSDYFGSLMSLDQIDHLITTLGGALPSIALAQAGETLDSASYTGQDGRLDVSRLLAFHSDGATLILNHLEDVLAPLADLCVALEVTFGSLFQANLYVTPPRQTGFAAHFDTHDVFLLQASGRKVWRLHASAIELPLPAQLRPVDPESCGPIIAEVELSAGDTLYLPRGVVHASVSGEVTSAHLTVGAFAYTWTDILNEALATTVLEDPAFRTALPRDFAGDGFDRKAARRTLLSLIDRFRDAADADAAFGAVRADFAAARRQRFSGQTAQLAALDRLSPDSMISLRPHLSFFLRDEPEAICIECYGKEIRVPSLGAEAVRFALAAQRFRVGDLPGSLDDSSRVALVRRLIREGLLIADGVVG
jgi:hypothetical protein